MTEQWIKEYMEALEKKMGTYTEQNLLQQDPNSELWFLRTAFAVYPDQSVNVIIQSMLFELKPGIPQLEIVVNITNDVEEENMEELQKAIDELNYISPVGTFGMRRRTNRLYLRNCWAIDEEKTIEQLIEEAESYYEMMMEGVQAVYKGLSNIWTGEMNYEETVEKDLLRRAED